MGYDATGKLVYGPNNPFLQSQTFDNASWVGANRTVTANTTVAPDGTTTADTLAGTGAGGALLRQDAAVSGVNSVVASFYVKADTATTCTISDVNFGGLGVFNLSTGTVVSGSGASISSAGNGWYRCAVVYAPSAGFARVTVNPGSSFNLNTTTSIFIWGAQLEAVTYQTTPSTYYPTTTAAYYGPRLVYDPVTLASLGILVEEARTNIALWNRDLTNAAWVKVNTTAAKTQTGIDGVANSASLLTATAGNGTCLQAITLASSARQQSAWVKRVTGAGVVEMTTDNGTTWTAVTVTASWTRVTIPVQTLANPTVGFRIVTSGDAIAVDFAQNEAGTGASSEIATTTAAVTRAADVAAVTGLAASYPLTMTADFTRNWDAGAAQIVAQVDAGSDAQRSYVSIDASDLLAGITSGSGSSTVAGATVAGTAYKGAARIATDDLQTARGGTLGTADTSATNPTNPTRLVIGGANAAGSPVNGTISRIRIYNRALPDAQLQSLTT
jgi:hypothetical protein